MNLRAINRLKEAIHYLEIGHEGHAAAQIDEARQILTLPENDPRRSEADRAAWRAARGQG